MNGHTTDWGPGLVALFAGLVIGFFLLRRSLRQSGAAAAPVAGPAPRREAAARYEALVAQLRDLEDNASQLEPERLARERYALELSAAGALLEMEAGASRSAATATAQAETVTADAAAPATVGSPALRGFLWGAGGVAALALLGVMVSRQATERREGGSLTGSIPGEEEQAAVPDDVARLQAAVAARPDDLDARLELSLAHLQRRELMAVFEQTQYVLERRPKDPRALSYQALVRLAMGQAPEAEAMLQTAIAADPDSLDARLHLGLVYLQQGRMTEAEASLAEAIRRHPEEREQIEGLLQQMREQAAQQAAAPAAGAGASPDPHAGVAPVAPAATATATAATVGADGVGVSIRLGAGLQGRGVLFVVVREAGQQAGPPIAARRVASPVFPLQVVLGASDSMMGQPLPEKLSLEARLDSDGDVTTRDPGDLVARRDGVARGSADTVLELKKP
ncbi:MAG: tetratricopeptide repeat protein [Vicinamibacteria bacterium]|nr:tetratricopeptide repeat protein [Vicinamibacteria bacterium]